MMEYSTFPKAPALLECHHQLFSVISRTLVGGGLTPTAEMQSVYSTIGNYLSHLLRAL